MLTPYGCKRHMEGNYMKFANLTVCCSANAEPKVISYTPKFLDDNVFVLVLFHLLCTNYMPYEMRAN